MTRLDRDVTVMARLGAFAATVPAFGYGIAFGAILLSDTHWVWLSVLAGLTAWSWHQSVGNFRTMYKTGRIDGSGTAWAEATEQCEAHHYCRICGGTDG